VERFGIHRSLEPPGVLPHQADRLNTSLPLKDDEVLIDVDLINVDSASWQQIRESTDGDVKAIVARILEIVREHGKLQNPVTGSGGMLVGTVVALGTHRVEPAIGTRIASLVSLAVTPLVLDEIVALDSGSERVKVKGTAILFGSSPYVEVPDDLPDHTVLSVLDVCGAPAWMARLAKPGMNVVVLGAGGKSGLLSVAQALRSVGPSGRVLGLCYPPPTTSVVEHLGAEAAAVDCTDPGAVIECVTEIFEGATADLVFVCANVPGCEGAAVLACSDEGRIVFFSMATSFVAAALTAEGMGKSCEMTIGNGYVPGHAELALNLVRDEPALAARLAG